MVKLTQHTLIRDGKERTINIPHYESPYDSPHVTKLGWKVKSSGSSESDEIINTNTKIINDKHGDNGNENTISQENTIKEIKAYLDENKIEYDYPKVQTKKADLLALIP